MLEHVTTFTPADGSAPRTITLRISDLRADPDGEAWSVAVDVLGFKHDLKTRVWQVDWPYAIRQAARFITDMVTFYAGDLGGGTFAPDIHLREPKRKKGKRKGKKGKGKKRDSAR